MKVSFSEIEVTFGKAALGAGIPLGLAEDFGRVNYWLATRKIGSLSVGLAALNAFDTEDSGSVATVESEPEWNLSPQSGQKLSALYAGSSACDLLCAQHAAIHLRKVDVPLLVLVSAVLASSEYSLAIQIELLSADGTTEVVFCDCGMVRADAAVLERFTVASALDMRLIRTSSGQLRNYPVAFPAKAPDEVFTEGATVDETEWNRIEQYAKRMLVPASETSRTGAGAGEIDCD